MTVRLLYTESYNRRAARFVRRYPDPRPLYEKTLLLLEAKPFHPSLRLNRLKGPLSALYSVSINISYRITLEFIIEDETIIPVDVGKHEEVY